MSYASYIKYILNCIIDYFNSADLKTQNVVLWITDAYH